MSQLRLVTESDTVERLTTGMPVTYVPSIVGGRGVEVNGWDEWQRGWSAEMRASGKSPHTISLRMHYVKDLAKINTEPRAINRTDLINWLGRERWGPEARKSARGVVVGLYRWAVAAGMVELSPAETLPSVAVPRGVPHPTPDRVVADAFGNASDRDRLIIMLGALAGLRRAEIAAVHDNDLGDGVLYVTGKGARERAVPLHPLVRQALNTELELRRTGAHGSGHRYWPGDGTGWLFPGSDNGHLSPNAVGKVLSKLLAGPWTGHSLRHRFASLAYAVDRDLLAVSSLLGHSRAETTERYTAIPAGARSAAVIAMRFPAA